jgi:hypothetical protein
MKKLSRNGVDSVGVYAYYMKRCGVYSISRFMVKNGLDISLALEAAKLLSLWKQRGWA